MSTAKKRFLPIASKNGSTNSPRTPRKKDKEKSNQQNGGSNVTPKSRTKLNEKQNQSPALKNHVDRLKLVAANEPDMSSSAEEDSFFGLNQENILKGDQNTISSVVSDKSLLPNYDNSSIKVAVRVRPFNNREVQNNAKNIVLMNGNVTTLRNKSGRDQEFCFDHSFWSFDHENPVTPYITQEHVYNCSAKPLLKYSFDGYNTCLFAYGQTGSGKSFTIMGYDGEDTGIVPRFSKDLFDKINHLNKQEGDVSYSVEISFYEIYNEKIFDLLSFSENKPQHHCLCVREHPDYGPYVQGLTTHIVGAYQDILDWLEVGNKNRATAATGMNDKSSRSHSVFTILLTQVSTQDFEGTGTQLQKQSKINLIDLAGSERASKVLDDRVIKDTQTMDTRIKEGGCINKSLHTLGKVISILSEMQMKPKRRPVHIPYRDSVLTWLLKESLGGNAKTTMIATISPSHLHYHETLSTLRYAHQARSIVNKAKVNEDPKSKLIREMLAEIERLKHYRRRTGDSSSALESEVKLLRQKLQETQGELTSSTKSWQEKLSLSEKKQKAAATHLRRSGVAFTKFEQRLPSLVNLNEDPQLAEVLLYILQEGVTVVGSKEAQNDHDIQLKGNLIAELHCTFTNTNESIALIPEGDAPTYVNGNLIADETILHHGDRIVVGGEHFFRLIYPKEAAQKEENQDEENRSPEKNFEFAKEELLNKQNKRLAEELEEARLFAEEEAMQKIKTAQIAADEELNAQRVYFQQQMSILQKKLEDSAGKQREAEAGQQNAQQIIQKMRQHQAVLEDKILSNKSKSQSESIAIKQNNRQKMRASIHLAVNQSRSSDQLDLLRISLMIREANKLSVKWNQSYKFGRDDLCNDDGKVEIRVRILNTDAQKSCLLDLNRFEEELDRMRDLSMEEKSVTFLNESEFHWTPEYSTDCRSTRLSLSESHFTSFNQSYDETTKTSMQNYQVNDESCNGTRNYSEMESQLCTSSMPAESTRLSSVQSIATESSSLSSKCDLSITRSEVFETILEIDNESEATTSIIASLIKLIISIYSDWKLLLSSDQTNITTQGEVTVANCVTDNPTIRIACNLKCLKDQSSILFAVHEAVGLDDLKKISAAFKHDVIETCLYVKDYIITGEEKPEDCMEQFKRLIYQMVELCGALSLAAVDHIKDDDNLSYIDDSEEFELCLFFLRQQNRFLATMMDEALCTVSKGIEAIKQFQLFQAHEMSEDLVDGVMNILTSTSTLIQRCKDLMMVYADIITRDNMRYYAKECFILRKFLTSVVDYNECIIHLVGQSKEIAANCDALDSFTDIPVEVADTTKRICATGRELYDFLSSKKNLEVDTLSLLRDCIRKFEFAGKTVRVGVAIVVQEVEKDLNITEDQSVMSLVQSDLSFKRNTSMCPLNRTSLDISAIHPQMQEKFKGRRSSIRPDMFISRYIDTSVDSYS